MHAQLKTEQSKSNAAAGGYKNKQRPFFSPVIVQPKLAIRAADDPYERQANAMTDKGMGMQVNEQPFFSPKPFSISEVQRKCHDCEKEETLQRRESTGGEVHADTSLQNYVGGLNSSGQPLPESSRQFFEPRFGADFSGVKIHDDSDAAKSAKSINALAYTSGTNIVFSENQFSPESDGDKKLLAHELTHIVQQERKSNDSYIQKAPGEQEDNTDDDLTADEVDIKVEQDELTEQFPDIQKIDGPELVKAVASFFIDYKTELARRQQIGVLQFPYQDERLDSDADMNALITELDDSITAGDVDWVNEILTCCDTRLELFRTESDLFESVYAFKVGQILELFGAGLLSFMDNLAIALKEFPKIIVELRKRVKDAEHDVLLSKVVTVIDVVLDGVELAIKVTNPEIAIGIVAGKYLTEKASHKWLGPHDKDTPELIENAEKVNDTIEVVAGTMEHLKKFEEIETGLKGVGLATDVVGVAVDVSEVVSAKEKLAKINEELAVALSKYKGLTDLYDRMGDKDGILKTKGQVSGIFARIKQLGERIDTLETQLGIKFKEFNKTNCKDHIPKG